MSDTDPRYPYYQAYLTMNACGMRVNFHGIQEERGPRLAQ